MSQQRDDILSELIREVLDDEPCNQCAEDGVSCAFCGAEWNQALIGMEHEHNCWIVRATTALKEIDDAKETV